MKKNKEKKNYYKVQKLIRQENGDQVMWGCDVLVKAKKSKLREVLVSLTTETVSFTYKEIYPCNMEQFQKWEKALD